MVFGNCGVLLEISPAKGYVEMTGIDAETSQDIAEVRNCFTSGVRQMKYLVICNVHWIIELWNERGWHTQNMLHTWERNLYIFVMCDYRPSMRRVGATWRHKCRAVKHKQRKEHWWSLRQAIGHSLMIASHVSKQWARTLFTLVSTNSIVTFLGSLHTQFEIMTADPHVLPASVGPQHVTSIRSSVTN